MNSQSLFERIKKLMALSKSSNPNEAAIALLRAQRLMKENAISSEDLEFSSFSEERIPTVRGTKNSKISDALAHIIIKAFGLEYFRTDNKSGNSTFITFIGPNDRLKSAVYIYTILVRQLQIVKKQYRDEQRGNIRKEITATIKRHEEAFLLFGERTIKDFIRKKTSAELNKMTKIYLMGWLDSIECKVEKFVCPDGEQELLTSYVNRNHPDIKVCSENARRLSYEEAEAYRLGRIKGQNGIDLFRGVNGSITPRLT